MSFSRNKMLATNETRQVLGVNITKVIIPLYPLNKLIRLINLSRKIYKPMSPAATRLIPHLIHNGMDVGVDWATVNNL